MLHIYKIVKTNDSCRTETDCATYENKENAIKALNGIFKFNNNTGYTYRIKEVEINTDDENTPPKGCRVYADFSPSGKLIDLVYDITSDPDIVDDKDYFIINKNRMFGEGYISIIDGESPEQYKSRIISVIESIMEECCNASLAS